MDKSFNDLWNKLVKNKLVEKELMLTNNFFWLTGAPGAGKGTNTPIIMDFCNIKTPPIIVSNLLKSSNLKKKKDSGSLIDDYKVVKPLFKKILEVITNYKGQNIIIDGFPRTIEQAKFIKSFYEKINSNKNNLKFHIIILMVDEQKSIERQLYRGIQAKDKNNKELIENIRVTDTSEEIARKRYRIFKDLTIPAINYLKNFFEYYFIDCNSDLKNVQNIIIKAFINNKY